MHGGQSNLVCNLQEVGLLMLFWWTDALFDWMFCLLRDTATFLEPKGGFKRLVLSGQLFQINLRCMLESGSMICVHAYVKLELNEH